MRGDARACTGKGPQFGKPRAIEVRVGLSDGSMTEVSGEGISAGLEVIVGQQSGGSASPAQKGAPPRMFF